MNREQTLSTRSEKEYMRTTGKHPGGMYRKVSLLWRKRAKQLAKSSPYMAKKNRTHRPARKPKEKK